jgi:hypothetical protein
LYAWLSDLFQHYIDARNKLNPPAPASTIDPSRSMPSLRAPLVTPDRRVVEQENMPHIAGYVGGDNPDSLVAVSRILCCAVTTEWLF